MTKQIAHVFRKDARHHWPVLAIAVALLALFAWVEPIDWTGVMPSPNLEILKGWLTLLVPVSWAFLIVRLVQDENLVGDRQFWVTRPYDWRKLLAEKILFVLAGIILPLFIAQIVLLGMAGFRPAAYLPGLLLLAVLWLLYFVLPAMTLAAITSSVGQAVAVVLGTMACLVAIGIALAEETGHSGLARQQSFADFIPPALGLAAAAAIVIWQYARRRTWKARLVLIAAVIIAAFVLPPVIPDKSIAGAYPYSSGQSEPAQLAFDDQTHELGAAPQQKNTVTVRLPLTVSGASCVVDRSSFRPLREAYAPELRCAWAS
jgi:hypothetical protein